MTNGEQAVTTGTVDNNTSMQHSTRSGALTNSTAEPQTRREKLRRKLVALGIARKENLSADGLLLYSKALEAQFADDVDTNAQLEFMMLHPRGEYEEKMPALPDLLEMIRSRGRARRRAVLDRSAIDEFDRLKAQCERERAEDQACAAAGEVRERSEMEVRLDAILRATAERLAQSTMTSLSEIASSRLQYHHQRNTTQAA